MPTQDDVLGYFRSLSTWGRWGDELGTLNHITDDVRRAAARAVRWSTPRPAPAARSTRSPRSEHGR
ncbi:hypothetical protein [Actinoplanes subglobosus]|uniref:Cyclase n=1 Tax=Actinoplanes subglobosus TaxID=1547892 RepID=A0ABV8J0N2_9ACTN